MYVSRDGRPSYGTYIEYPRVLNNVTLVRYGNTDLGKNTYIYI